uniref:Putative secreted protein n=1 Tax=Anopheles darlingi TaxID=43151 RepID=A0A2M4DA04_ANODA
MRLLALLRSGVECLRGFIVETVAIGLWIAGREIEKERRYRGTRPKLSKPRNMLMLPPSLLLVLRLLGSVRTQIGTTWTIRPWVEVRFVSAVGYVTPGSEL